MAIATLARELGERGRAELVDREGHSAEETAGIVLLVGTALLIRHAVFGRRNEILGGALNTDDRENAESDEKLVAVVTVIKRTVHAGGDPGRNIVAAATAAAASGAGLHNAGGEQNGVHDLHHSDGQVVRIVVAIAEVTRTDAGITTVNTDVPYATVKNDLLLHHGNTGELLVATKPHAGLQVHLNIKADGNLVEALVEADGIYADVSPENPGAFRTHIGAVLDNLLPEIGKKDAGILVAIAVTAGIQYAKGIDTDGFPVGRGAAAGRASIIRHLVFPPIIE